MNANYKFEGLKKYSLSDLEKMLETKINQHKMLSDTLHEVVRKAESSPYTLNRIKSEIDSTLGEIEGLRKRIASYVGNTNVFDSIKKEYEEQKKKAVNIFDSIKKEEPEKIEKVEYTKYSNADSNKKYEVKHTVTNYVGDVKNYDDVTFCNRFVAEVDALAIPTIMVKWIGFSNMRDRYLTFCIYDFIAADGEPIISKLVNDDGRKFTFEILHLDPTGVTIYKERYVGCYLDKDEITRDSLRYEDNDVNTIMFKLHFDGVSYEATK